MLNVSRALGSQTSSRAFPVTLSHSKDRTNNHTRSLQPTHYRNPPSIFKAVRVRYTTSSFMWSPSFPLLIIHVAYEISQLRWSARAPPIVLYSPHLGVLLPAVIWFQAFEVYHQPLSSPPGTCFSPASSGLRTNRPCPWAFRWLSELMSPQLSIFLPPYRLVVLLQVLPQPLCILSYQPFWYVPREAVHQVNQ
ncbi:hypothetical protein T03_13251 [Trichinella britovi]|uniref:Uncharacterized protein n=1 Tax=Trichinella britovi TaxID=45882 RepID=A0A0V1C867_TRIBR|nr:hypothetical protein T03_13251 [Trichinella britovi]